MPTSLPSKNICAFEGLLFIIIDPAFVWSTAVKDFTASASISTLSRQTSYLALFISNVCLPGFKSVTVSGVVPTSLPSKNIFALDGSLSIMIEPVFIRSTDVKVFSAPTLTSTLSRQTSYLSFITSTSCMPGETACKVSGVVPTSLPSRNILAFAGSLFMLIEPVFI
ncbi:MAG: hypothetical protein MAG551_02208 [Candidatus Scalindua arabica]|uniref:Uncharacterized protein n=1 Tax=Candidatus Scalindua arabica TaxID=1127984 RepID=A0A942A6I5_9BACT|nr:hypothetical protein [Candidatus Scalindua arabica]